MKNNFTRKDITYLIIIFILISLFVFFIFAILFKLDAQINILSADNWINIFMGLATLISSSILSIIVIFITIANNKKMEYIQKESYTYQMKMNIYKTYMKVHTEAISNQAFSLIFYQGKNEENKERFNKILDNQLKLSSELTIAYNEAEQIFKGDISILLKINNHYYNYIDKICKGDYKASDEEINELRKLIENDKFDKVFDENIYIDKN